MARSKRERSQFEQLPVKVVHRIISFLLEPRSLQSLSYTSWKLFYIIHTSKRSLLQRITLNCLGGDEVLAMATWVYRCQPPQLISSANDVGPEGSNDAFLTDKLLYIDHFLETRPSTLSDSTWPIQDAIEICDFHITTVRLLAEQFLDSCHDSSVLLARNLVERAVSATEMRRTVLALYGFELFRRLFGAARASMSIMKTYYQSFFTAFAPWESAQMSCIHDFIARIIITAITSSGSASDKLWKIQEREKQSDTEFSRPQLQFYMTLGLEWVVRLQACDSSVERQTLLKSGSRKHKKGYFWTSVFKKDRICQIKEEMDRLVASEPLFAETDAGPQRIWHMSRMASETVGSLAIYEFMDWRWRRWGYAMWDFERLWALGAIRHPWNHQSIV